MKPTPVDQSARQQDIKAAGAKTAEPSPQNGAYQQKAAEPNASSGNKGERLLEKAGHALEAVTGRSPTTKEGSSQEGASQMKPTAVDQSQQDMKTAGDKCYSYPDWPAVAKTRPASQGSKE